MKNATLVVCILSFFIVLPLGSATPKDTGEILEFALDEEWKVANSAGARNYTILEFVRQGDDINSWKELVTMQNFGRSRGYRSPSETIDELKALREKECPGVTQWNVIEKTENSILFEWHAKECLGQPEQCEVSRILYGKRNVFVLHYAAKVHELTPETRAEWIKRFAAASINSKTSALYLNAESRDVDEVIPFAMDKVMTALKPAMESAGCKVTEAAANRIECKRARVHSQQASDEGAEKVTAVLEGNGGQTRVRISTGKGFYGRLGKKNWSTPIYQEMLKSLQKTPE
jgi:hypothetical protein